MATLLFRQPSDWIGRRSVAPRATEMEWMQDCLLAILAADGNTVVGSLPICWTVPRGTVLVQKAGNCQANN